jgi:DNA helicase-2/ATP-dependent DNA helicase PcrA
MQYLLTSLLAGKYRNICVVGDDDQSIYRFRGATIENILDFEDHFRGCRTIRLEQNYRSTQCILDAANAVISNNRGRKGKKLWTNNPSGDPVTVFTAGDQMHEANYIASQILKRSGDRSFKDYAILYRTNAQSNALEDALRAKQIPYRIIGGTRFFDHAEIKDVLAYLHVINNRMDDLRLKRIINNPPRGLGNKTIETVQRLADAESVSLYRIVSDPYSFGPLEKAATKLMQFTAMIEELADYLEGGMPLQDFYDVLIERTGYIQMLEKKPTEENKTRIENVRELKSSIQNYVKNAIEPTLAGFLEEISLYTDIEEYSDEDDTVVLMTIHSAKGLEFSHVFIAGFEDGLFPGMRSIGDPDEMEEERRLCYVAITRAKEALTITHAHQRMLYGRTSAALASRFLREIPERCLLRQGHVQTYSSGIKSSYGQRENVASSYLSFTAKPKVQTVSVPEYRKGELIEHRMFGKGMILTVQPMGGDALLEIAFDQVGTKKMMAKTASAYMQKLS